MCKIELSELLVVSLSADSSDAKERPMREHLLQRPWNGAPASDQAAYSARNEVLREENARLKDLVVRLSAIIVQNVIRKEK